MPTPWPANDRSQSGDQLPGRAGGDVEVDLLGPVRVPNDVQTRSVVAGVSIVMVEKGESGLRRKIRARSAAGGSPSGHTLSSGDEQVGVRRPAAMTLEVLELGTLARDVVDHHVEQDVVRLAPRRSMSAQVPNAGLDLAVGQRREATIARRWERRQDVHATEQACQRAIQESGEGREVTAERVGIGQQLGSRGDGSEGEAGWA